MKRFPFTLVALCALFAGRAGAAPVSQADAKHAVAAWLATAPVLDGGEVQRIWPTNAVSYRDDDGTVLFHMVALEKGGFVLTAADDSISPILLYSTTGEPPDEDPQNPLWTLAAMSVRNQRAAETAWEWTDDPKADTLGESVPANPRDEWAALLDVDLGKLDKAGNPVQEVSDIRVDRILGTGASSTHAYHLSQETAVAANSSWNYKTTYKYANISQQFGSDFADRNYANWSWGCGVVAVAKNSDVLGTSRL